MYASLLSLPALLHQMLFKNAQVNQLPDHQAKSVGEGRPPPPFGPTPTGPEINRAPTHTLLDSCSNSIADPSIVTLDNYILPYDDTVPSSKVPHPYKYTQDLLELETHYESTSPPLPP